MAVLSRIPVDTSRFSLIVASEVRPVALYEDGARVEGRQATSPEGVPLWVVELAAFAPPELGGGLVSFRVKFPSATDPVASLPVQSPAQVSDLVAGVMRDGTVYFSASGLVAAASAQEKRPA
jgi:hypothetical protein